MIPIEEARSLVLENISVLETVTLNLHDSCGLVLSNDVISEVNVPPFRNSAMDGFALFSEDTVDGEVQLEVVASVFAGDSPYSGLRRGQAVRIMTGAVVPHNADAVVMQELTDFDGTVKETVLVKDVVAKNTNIRDIGEDILDGSTVFESGEVVSPAHIGVLASIGCESVRVIRRANVGVLSTGNELISEAESLGDCLIRDSNRPTLLAAINSIGANAIDLGHVRDDELLIEKVLIDGAAKCDLIFTSGGVSVGDADLEAKVLKKLSGNSAISMSVAVKPGKPLAIGKVVHTPVIGLPGNPVAAMVSFLLFGAPAIRKLMGQKFVLGGSLSAISSEDITRSKDGKVHLDRAFHYVNASGRIEFKLLKGQGSHLMKTMAKATSLAVIVDGEGLRSGEEAQLMLFPWRAVI